MSVNEGWTRLSARIHSLMSASEVAAALSADRSADDSFGAYVHLAEDADDVAYTPSRVRLSRRVGGSWCG